MVKNQKGKREPPVSSRRERFREGVRRGPNGWTSFVLSAGVLVLVLVFMWQVDMASTGRVFALHEKVSENTAEIAVLNESLKPAVEELKVELRRVVDSMVELTVELTRCATIIETRIMKEDKNGRGK